MNQLPQSTAELLDRVEQEWSRLLSGLASLSPAQMTTPDADGWSIKDHLAHLTHWEQWLLRHHIAGEPAHDILKLDAAMLEEFDTDWVNEQVRQQNSPRSLPEVLDNLHQTHAEVVATLRQMPFDKLLQPRYADDPEQRPLLNWVAGDTYEHYQEHSAALPN